MVRAADAVVMVSGRVRRVLSMQERAKSAAERDSDGCEGMSKAGR